MALPEWILTDLGAGKLGIECPRCHNKAIVSRRHWLKDHFYEKDETKIKIIGRACTYCFAASAIPRRGRKKRRRKK